MNLANRLIKLRKQRNWTQAQAARNIDIQQSYLSKLENGRNLPSEEVLQKLCAVYQVSEDELMLDKEKVNSVNRPAIAVLLLAVMLILAGHFKLFFEDTYFTYKLTERLPAGVILPATHFTDQYRGDRYTLEYNQLSFEYQLIAQRQISRVENRWLLSAGMFMFFVGMVLLVMRIWPEIKTYKKAPNASGL